MNTLQSLRLMTLLSLASPLLAHAQVPAAREGTETRLSDTEVQFLQRWIDNANSQLNFLKDAIRYMSPADKRAQVVAEFTRIVSESGAKDNELLMRFVMNRALGVNEMVGANPRPNELDTITGLLVQTIGLAQSYYTEDQAYLAATGRGASTASMKPMPAFGLEYADNLLSLSQSFLDPKIEYKITRNALAWLMVDLGSARNLDRALFADEALAIRNLLQAYSEEPVGSDISITQTIRRMKQLYREKIQAAVQQKLLGINAPAAIAPAPVGPVVTPILPGPSSTGCATTYADFERDINAIKNDVDEWNNRWNASSGFEETFAAKKRDEAGARLSTYIRTCTPAIVLNRREWESLLVDFNNRWNAASGSLETIWAQARDLTASLMVGRITQQIRASRLSFTQVDSIVIEYNDKWNANSGAMESVYANLRNGLAEVAVDRFRDENRNTSESQQLALYDQLKARWNASSGFVESYVARLLKILEGSLQ